MRPQQPLQERDLIEGDDVIVVFPSGRQAEGRIEEMVRWNGRLYNIVVWVDDYRDNRIYPPGWVYPWGEAPE